MNYIWKCENCGDKFEAENPSQCLKCGYDDILKFNHNDLSTFNRDMHKLTGIPYAGIQFE